MHLRIKASYRPAAHRADGFMPVRLTTGMDQQGAAVWMFEIYYRRLLVALALLAVTGYFIAATALYYWLAQNPHNQVKWTDLVAPWQWSTLDKKRGDAAVLTAMDEIKAENYSSAFYNLRVGLVRSPGNADGRLVIAQLLAGFDPHQAILVMEEGVPACLHDDQFVAALLYLYSEQQIQDHALEVISTILEHHGGLLSPASRLALSRAQFELWLQLGRYAEANTALGALRSVDPAYAPARSIQYCLQTRQVEEAKKIFDENYTDRLAEPAISKIALDLAVALGDAELLQRVILRVKVRNPDDSGTYLFAIQAWHRLKRLSFRDAAEQEYYQLFSTNEAALQTLAGLAVNLNMPEVLARAQRIAVDGRFNSFAFRVRLTEWALRHQQVELAVRSLRDWEQNIDTLNSAQRFYPEFIKRLARVSFTGAADQQVQLLSHLNANRLQANLSVYMLAANVLMEGGDLMGANQIVQAAQVLYRQSDPLLALHQKLAASLALVKSVNSPFVESLPSQPIPFTAIEAYQQLDGFLGQDAFLATRDLLRAIRAQQPTWLSSSESEISLREVELAILTLDSLASRSAVRVYLDRYRGEDDVLRLVGLVDRLVARDRLVDARLLRDEITGAPGVTGRVQQALRGVTLSDDLAEATATKEAAWAGFDRAIANQNWAQAERLLKYLRDKPPAWAATAPIELKVSEVQIRLGLGQRILALAALKDLVNKAGVGRGAAFKLVRDFVAQNDYETAQTLAKEILRLLPDDPAVQRLVKECEVPNLVP